MSKPFLPVRIKEKLNLDKDAEFQYSRIRLISFDDYTFNSTHKSYGSWMKKHPYKWWQIWYLIEVPAFYVQRILLRSLNTKEIKKTKIASLILVSIFEGLLAYLIAEGIKFVATLTYD